MFQSRRLSSLFMTLQSQKWAHERKLQRRKSRYPLFQPIFNLFHASLPFTILLLTPPHRKLSTVASNPSAASHSQITSPRDDFWLATPSHHVGHFHPNSGALRPLQDIVVFFLLGDADITTGASWFHSQEDREKMISFLQDTERTVGWPTRSSVESMKKEWGWSP
jgi:hypothetical protein